MILRTIVGLLLAVVLIEVFLQFLVHWLRKDFQWLITKEDENVTFDHESLNSFIAHGFDPILGWARKANTKKTEKIKGVGEFKSAPQQSSYSISNNNARYNPGHEHLSPTIATFGDSFAFCRHVNDNQTWQWHLSELTNSNVLNFGVGNYCIGQSLMRMKSELHGFQDTSEVAVMMAVPETISRIGNVWKHYSEYGNTFGFKGRYYVEDGALRWFDNVVNDTSQFENLQQLLPLIQQWDYCYQNKFRKDQLRFSYTASLIRSYKRNVPLILYSLLRKLALGLGSSNELLLNKAWETVLKGNNSFAVSLYSNRDITRLFQSIVLEFKEEARKKGTVPVFVMVPYLHDVRDFQKNKSSYYEGTLGWLEKELIVIDMMKPFSNEKNADDLYVNTFYGAHLSGYGNEVVAKEVYSELRTRTQFFGKPKIS